MKKTVKSNEQPTAEGAAAPVTKVAPTHYKVLCISMYTKDLEKLDAMVDELKSKGITKMSRSSLIRQALGALDINTVRSAD